MKQTEKGPWGLPWSRRPEARKELRALGHGIVEVQRAEGSRKVERVRRQRDTEKKRERERDSAIPGTNRGGREGWASIKRQFYLRVELLFDNCCFWVLTQLLKLLVMA